MTIQEPRQIIQSQDLDLVATQEIHLSLECLGGYGHPAGSAFPKRPHAMVVKDGDA
jgi:hypothetical protein